MVVNGFLLVPRGSGRTHSQDQEISSALQGLHLISDGAYEVMHDPDGGYLAWAGRRHGDDTAHANR